MVNRYRGIYQGWVSSCLDKECLHPTRTGGNRDAIHITFRVCTVGGRASVMSVRTLLSTTQSLHCQHPSFTQEFVLYSSLAGFLNHVVGTEGSRMLRSANVPPRNWLADKIKSVHDLAQTN